VHVFSSFTSKPGKKGEFVAKIDEEESGRKIVVKMRVGHGAKTQAGEAVFEL